MATYSSRDKDLQKFIHIWQADDLFGDIKRARRQSFLAQMQIDKYEQPGDPETEEASARALVSIATSLATLTELIARGYTHP
jgi:hypothetical protein